MLKQNDGNRFCSKQAVPYRSPRTRAPATSRVVALTTSVTCSPRGPTASTMKCSPLARTFDTSRNPRDARCFETSSEESRPSPLGRGSRAAGPSNGAGGARGARPGFGPRSLKTPGRRHSPGNIGKAVSPSPRPGAPNPGKPKPRCGPPWGGPGLGDWMLGAPTPLVPRSADAAAAEARQSSTGKALISTTIHPGLRKQALSAHPLLDMLNGSARRSSSNFHDVCRP